MATLIVFLVLITTPRLAVGAGEEMVRLNESRGRSDEEAPVTARHVEIANTAAENEADVSGDKEAERVVRSSVMYAGFGQ